MHAYECAEIDSLEFNNQVCVARQINYNKVTLDFMTDLSSATIEMECAEANNGGNNCETRVCIAELAFLRDFWPNYLGHITSTYDANLSEYKHSNGFDPDVRCPLQNYPIRLLERDMFRNFWCF